MSFRLNRLAVYRGVQLVRLLLLILLISGNSSLHADSFTDGRVVVGLKIFRTLVSADLMLEDKRQSDNSLKVLVIDASNSLDDSQYQKYLESELHVINKIPVELQLLSIEEFKAQSTKTRQQNKHNQIAAIFIAQRLNSDELKAVLEFGFRQNIIIFSPFEGDVEQGVLGGLSVQATVRPLINLKSLKLSGLSIKPFYLKVAKLYE